MLKSEARALVHRFPAKETLDWFSNNLDQLFQFVRINFAISASNGKAG